MEGGRRKEEAGLAGKPRGFKGLIAWQKAMSLASSTYAATCNTHLPSWLESQVMSAALSVPSNIAEGYTRGGLKDYLRFLDYSRASLAELESHLHFMAANGLLENSASDALDRQAAEVGNVLVALMRSLARKLKDGSWNRLSEERAEYFVTIDDDSLLPPSSFLLPREEV